MTDERIVERIRKMLALANDNSTTEHERETALRMAYNLLAKYNLELSDVEKKHASEKRTDTDSVYEKMYWVRLVSNNIAKLMFCTYYTMDTRYDKDGKRIRQHKTSHHFVGKESNAVTASVMANWIVMSIMKEARTRYGHPLSSDARNFSLGAAERLAERITEMRKEAEAVPASNSKALALVDVYKAEATANELFLQSTGIRLKDRVNRAHGGSGSSYGNGRAYGDTINLNRQVGAAPRARLR